MSVSKLLNFTKNALTKYPMLTNGAIYGTFYVAAEFSQQYIRKLTLPDHPEINYADLPKFGFLGSCVMSPILYLWYSKVLDRYIIGKGIKAVVTKLVIDQTIMTSLLLVCFYVGMSILEQKPDIFQDLREKYYRSFLANQIFWIPAQTINFMYIPQKYRVVFIASGSFIWINMLCFLKREERSKENKITQ